MRQSTLASVSFDKHSKQTRRAQFLAEMTKSCRGANSAP